jgi:hypothetical protein
MRQKIPHKLPLPKYSEKVYSVELSIYDQELEGYVYYMDQEKLHTKNPFLIFQASSLSHAYTLLQGTQFTSLKLHKDEA